MRRFVSRAFFACWRYAILLIPCLITQGGVEVIAAGQQQRTMLLPGKEGRLLLYYLCKPNGILNHNPCNPDGGKGLLGISEFLEKKSARGESALFFITGELFPLERERPDPLQSLHASFDVDYLVKTYKTMDVTAVLPGFGDLLLGIDRFKELAEKSGLRPICANLVRQGGKEPVFEPYFFTEMNGFKIGITAVINPRTYSVDQSDPGGGQQVNKRENVLVSDMLDQKDLEVIEPLECLQVLADELKEKGADFTVALSHLTMKRSKDILKTTSIDLVLGNNLCRKDGYRRRVDGIRAATIHSVESLGRMEFYFTGDSTEILGDKAMLESLEVEQSDVRAQIRNLENRYGTTDSDKLERLAFGTEDGMLYRTLKERNEAIVPEVAQIRQECQGSYFYNQFIGNIGCLLGGESKAAKVLSEYLVAMKKVTEGHEEEILAFVEGKIDQENYLTGSEACRDCHPRQFAHWQNTKHAQAFAPVSRLGFDFHPECIKCHSTGFRVKGGFLSPPPPEKLRSINCEACHGFLGDHVKDFLEPTHAKLKGDTMKVAAICTYCHTQERSPEFDFPSAIKTVPCPPIDFNAPDVRAFYLEQDRIMSETLAENGAFKNSYGYVKAAIYKKRLGADREEILDLLFKGFAMDSNNIDLVKLLYLFLLEEERAVEALDVMETYIADNPTNPEVNLEIIKLLTLAPKVRDPKAARDYIAWYLENLSKGNIEVYLLLATADMYIGDAFHLDEAWAALEQAERMKPKAGDKEKIKMLRQQLIQLRKK